MAKYKNNFVMFCKTFLKEKDRFEFMLSTFNQFNMDKVILFVSVPEKEKFAYDHYSSPTVKVITDESYGHDYFTTETYWGLTPGYINQEICKLSFWETSNCKNYLCIDSDLYFIRPFHKIDFMVDEFTPYSVLVMDKDLQIEDFYRDFAKWRRGLIKKIFEEVGLEDSRYRTCHGMQVMNSDVLCDFKINFMDKKGISYKDLIKLSPYEFTWYNAWLQKSKLIPVVATEPFFKTFHSEIEFLFSKTKKIKEKHIAEQYIGIVLNSNWSGNKMIKYQNPNLFNKLLFKLNSLQMLDKYLTKIKLPLLVASYKFLHLFDKNRTPIYPGKAISPMNEIVDLILNWTSLKPKNVFEIGANLAQDAEILRTGFKVLPQNVYVFEPHPELFKRITSTYKFKAYNIAISNKKQVMSFQAINLKNAANNGISSLRRHKGVDSSNFMTIKVKAITMDYFMKQYKIKIIDFLKIDVEGCTYEVLEGFGESLKFVNAIHLEAEHKVVWKGQRLWKDIEDMMKKNSFELISYKRFKEQSDSLWVKSRYLT